MSSRDDLRIDIYYDAYPKPVLVDTINNNNLHETPKIGDIEMPDINSPRDVIEIPNKVEEKQTIVVDNSENTDQTEKEFEHDITNTRGICHVVVCTLICIGIGIACLIIALEENQPSSTHMIYLEGNIIFVFYLGIAILSCIAFCLSAAACARCCDICFVLIS